MTKQDAPDYKPVLLSEEVATVRYGINPLTFRRWVAANCIEPVLVPGAERRMLYRQEDIEAFVQGR